MLARLGPFTPIVTADGRTVGLRDCVILREWSEIWFQQEWCRNRGARVYWPSRHRVEAWRG